MPPANDNLADFQAITGLVGSVAGSTVGATLDSPYDPIVDNFPPGDASVWFRLPVPGGWDTDWIMRLAFSGTTIDPVTVVFAADPYPPTGTGDVSVLAAADTLTLTLSGASAPPTGFFYIGIGAADSDPASTTDFVLSWLIAAPGEPVGIAIAPFSETFEPDALWIRLDDNDAAWKVTGFTVDRGKSSELERNDAGTATIELIDRDGTFDPTNPAALFPLTLAAQAAITVQNPVTGEWRHLFRGFTKLYPGQFYVTGRQADVALQLGDGFDYLQGVLMYPDDPIRFGDTPPTGVGPNLYFPQTGGVTQVRGRLNLALDQAEWPADWRHVFSGNIILQAWQYPPGTSIFSVLEEAVEAEFPAVGVHFMSRRGNYVFRGRYPRFDPDSYLATEDDIRAGPAGEGGRLIRWSVGGQPQAAADLGTVGEGYRDGTAVIADLAYRLGWDDVINAAGALPNLVDEDDVPGNLVVDTASVDQYGWRFGPDMDNLLVQHGNTPPGYNAVQETRFYAEYWVENFKQPVTRITRLLFRPRDANDVLAPALWAFILGVELGDVVHVQTTHYEDVPGFDADYFIEGIRYRATNLGRPGLPDLELELEVSPSGFYSHNPWDTTADGDVPEE